MNAAVVVIMSLFIYILAYRFYGRFLSRRVFALDPGRLTPAHQFQDGQDYVPTKKAVLLGHHFTSIAGAGPIVGPAIAVLWGWLPALLWVIIGPIFMGAVHDFGSLFISARHQGRSLSDITGEIMGPRARNLFFFLTAFALLILLTVFALVVALLFEMFPGSVLAVWLEIPIATGVGLWIYRRGGSSKAASVIALIMLYILVVVGSYLPIQMPGFILDSPAFTWVVILLVYGAVASVLPVWLLLQPRDYINYHQLIVFLVVVVAGILVSQPRVVAPALNLAVEGAPRFIPFIFIVVACGAISGFHNMVSSGTTAKQLDREPDALPVGYGGMLMEAFLAVIVILACTAGFSSLEAWNQHYYSWQGADGLGAKVGAFISGGASFISVLGIPEQLAAIIMAVMVVSFVATSLDSTTRIQRYIISELAAIYNVKALASPRGATLLAVLSALALASIDRGYGGMILWPLFGAFNQLMAGLALVVITVWLLRAGKPVIYTVVPMVFMLSVTAWAMLESLLEYYRQGNWLLSGFSIILILMAAWVIVEALQAWRGEQVKGRVGEGPISNTENK